MEQKKIEEFVEKAKQAKSPEEVEAAAKACGLELAAEKVAKLEEALRGAKGELTDEELAGVAGGLEYGTDEFWHYVSEQIQKYGPEIAPALVAAYMPK